MMTDQPTLIYSICDWLNKPFVRPRPPGRESYEAYAQYEYDMARYTMEELRPITYTGKVVLDVGCGSGGKSVFFAQQGVKQLVAIDIEPKRLDMGRAFAQHHGIPEGVIDFCQADAMNLPFAPETFDVVLANDSFEHFFELPQAVAECFRVLKPGGYLGFNLLPYPSRDGAHLYDYIQIPWCQYVLPESWLVAYWKTRYEVDYHQGVFRSFSLTPDELCEVRTIRELAHVNQLSLGQIKRIVRRAGFQRVREEHHYSRKLALLQYLPWLHELVTYAYKGVYQKPVTG